MPNPEQSQEPFSVPEYFADEANNLRIVNGVFRLTLYSLSGGTDEMSMPVCHVAMPIHSVAALVAKALQVITATVPIHVGGIAAGPKGDGRAN